MESEWGYRLTKQADADFDDIAQYIKVDLANPRAASDFANELHAAIEEACFFPESGSPVSNEFLSVSGVRKKQVGSYVLFYLPDHAEKTILVLRILYGRRNLDEILRQI